MVSYQESLQLNYKFEMTGTLNSVQEVDFEKRYNSICLLAQGKFSTVHKVSHSEENGEEYYAMKIFKNVNAAEIEISWIEKFQGEQNFVKLVDIVHKSPVEMCVVFELCREDFFFILIACRILLNDAEKKIFLLQLLNGLDSLHSKGLMHRDMRSANLLLSNYGLVKICDLGSVTESPPANAQRSKIYSCDVGFRWYKAPELLLGDKKYCEKIDIWALGCIAFELWSNRILFSGYSKESQLKLITKNCGFISKTIWDDVDTLEDYKKYSVWACGSSDSHLNGQLQKITGDEAATDFILNLLHLNPYKRLTAGSLKKHRYFRQSPPEPVHNLARILEEVDAQFPKILREEETNGLGTEVLQTPEENVLNESAQEEEQITLQDDHLVI